MKKLFGSMFLIALFTAVMAEEINVDSVIAAHQAGVSADTILMLLQDPSNSVAPLQEGDASRLAGAGVPQKVIDALTGKPGEPVQAKAPAPKPDNQDLYALVKLVKSGLSQKIVVDQIAQAGVSKKPTVNDLIFLKENEVPEIVIVALMNAPVSKDGAPLAVASTKTAVASSQPEEEPESETEEESVGKEEKKTFEGLVFQKFFRDRPGKLVFDGEKLLWRDGQKGKLSFDMYMDGIKKIVLAGTPQDDGVFYFRVTIQFTRGDDYAFEDAAKEVGGNENITALVNYFKEHYPDIEYVEKSK